MKKEIKVEAVSLEDINHSGLNNLGLFFDFAYIDDEPYFVRKNNLLAMFFPFLASKLWYRPFKVSKVAFEKLKRRSNRRYGVGVIVLGGLLINYSGFNLLSVSALPEWQINLKNIPNEFNRIFLTFLILLFGFLLFFVMLNLLWQVSGYIILKLFGFRDIHRQNFVKLQKISHYQNGNRRKILILISWLLVFIGLPLQSLFLKNATILLPADIAIFIGLVTMCSVFVMLTGARKYNSKKIGDSHD